MSADYPNGVDDGRDTPPELTSDGELHVGVDDLGVSHDLASDDVQFSEADAALLYELFDVLDEHVNNGDVSPVQASAALSAVDDAVLQDIGIPDRAVLEGRFGMDPRAAAVLQRPRSGFDRARLALARRVAP